MGRRSQDHAVALPEGGEEGLGLLDGQGLVPGRDRRFAPRGLETVRKRVQDLVRRVERRWWKLKVNGGSSYFYIWSLVKDRKEEKRVLSVCFQRLACASRLE